MNSFYGKTIEKIHEYKTEIINNCFTSDYTSDCITEEGKK